VNVRRFAWRCHAIEREFPSDHLVALDGNEVSTELVGSGRYYTGGKDPDSLSDHFTLRVAVSGGGVGSSTITVYEDESARMCFM